MRSHEELPSETSSAHSGGTAGFWAKWFTPLPQAFVGALLCLSMVILADNILVAVGDTLKSSWRSTLLLFLGFMLLLALSSSARALVTRTKRSLSFHWGRLLLAIVLLGSAFCPWLAADSPLETSLARFLLAFSGLALALTSRLPCSAHVRDMPFRACRTPHDDQLGFRHHAEELASFLQTERPLTFGITGRWGSGKTSFVNLVLHYLRDGTEHRTAFFNPWKAKDRVDAWHLFARAIDDCFFPSAPERKPLARLVSAFVSSMLGVPKTLGDSLRDFLEHGSRYDERSRQRLESHLARLLSGGHLFVVVDDCDRAEPDVARGVFVMIDEMTQLNSSCTFLFAIDRVRLIKPFDGPDDAEGFFLKVFPRHQPVPPVEDSQLATWLERSCGDAPRLTSCLKKILSVLPDGLRSKLSFIIYAATFERMYLRGVGPEDKEWSPLFLFLLLEYQLEGFREVCRREDIAQKIQDRAYKRELGRVDESDRDEDWQRLKKDILKHNAGQGENPLIDRALAAWLDSFEIFSTGINPQFVLEIGPRWLALADKEFDSMFEAWLREPARLLPLAQQHKTAQVSIEDAMNAFLARALVQYDSGIFSGPSVRYEEEREDQSRRVLTILKGFVDWAISPPFRSDLGRLSDERMEQLFRQFCKRPSLAMPDEIDAVSLHGKVLEQCVAAFPVQQIAKLYFLGFRDDLVDREESDLTARMRAMLADTQRRVHLRYGKELIDAFRSPDGPASLVSSEFQESLDESLRNPGLWFVGENEGRFGEVVGESLSNRHIREHMWCILRYILPGRQTSAERFVKLYQNYPEFVKGVWHASHVEMFYPQLKEAVLERRDRAKDLLPSIDTELPCERKG
jgi:hypothetical protein